MGTIETKEIFLTFRNRGLFNFKIVDGPEENNIDVLKVFYALLRIICTQNQYRHNYLERPTIEIDESLYRIFYYHLNFIQSFFNKKHFPVSMVISDDNDDEIFFVTKKVAYFEELLKAAESNNYDTFLEVFNVICDETVKEEAEKLIDILEDKIEEIQGTGVQEIQMGENDDAIEVNVNVSHIAQYPKQIVFKFNFVQEE